MVGRTFWKECLRAVRGSLSRFLAIFAIVALGTGFLAGLMATTPDMRHTVSRLYQDTHLYDVRVVGTLGLEEGDALAVAGVDGVAAVMPARSVDREVLLASGDTLVGRFHAVSAWEGDDPARLNRTVLYEGRWPQSPDECVVELENTLRRELLKVGDTLTLVPPEEEEEGEEPEDPFTRQQFTIVGVVTSGYYISTVQRGSTSVGSGALGCIVYVDQSVLDLDYYTDLYVAVEGGGSAEAFTDAYDRLVEPVTQRLEQLAESQRHVRAERLRGDAQEELDDARRELEEKTAEGQEELDDALRKLEEGEADYAQGLLDYEDGLRQLADGRKELEDGEAELPDALQALEDGEEEYRQGLEDYQQGLEDFRQGQQEIEDAQAELDEAYQTLQEGWRELQKAQFQLENGEAELEEGQRQLDVARNELNEGQTQLDEARKQLSQQQAELDQGQRQLDAAQSQLEQQQSQLDAGKADLDRQQAQLEAAHAAGMVSDEAYGAGLQQIQAGQAQLEQAQSQLDAGRAELNRQQAELSAGQTQLNAAGAEIARRQAQIDDGLSQIRNSQRELSQGAQLLADGRKEYEAAKKEVDDGEIQRMQGFYKLEEAKKELADAWEQLEDAKKELEDGRKELDDGWTEYWDGQREIEDGWAELAENQQKLEDARIELEDARKELDDGWAEYRDGQQEFEDKISNARMKLRDAQDQIDSIEDPEWYVLSRSQSNEGYIYYESDTEKVSAIARVFPLFFFLVAALVASTTMTRMIDEDRGNLGTLKALGYSNGAITGKYLLYAAMACLLGAGVGLGIGLPLFPRVISNAYAMMYQLPPVTASSHKSFVVLSTAVILAAVLAATMGALRGSLRDNAAVLMRPKAPPAGKRILLERIRPVWRRMTFTHKVTARNLFRYKKRFFMTIVGITGCTALLLAGFGLRDSIRDIVHIQFTQLETYNLTLTVKHPGDEAADRRIAAILQDESQVEEYLPVHREVGTAVNDGRETAVELVAPSDIQRFLDFHVFRDRLSGEILLFDGSGVILTEKAARVLGLEAGDTLTLRDQDDREARLPIAAVCENYVQGYVFLSPELYRRAFGEACEYTSILAKANAPEQADRDQMATALLQSSNATRVSFSTDTVNTFEDMLSSVDYIVVVLIIAAAALAFVVLYNLTNINICERQKEIATLKVLGFRQGEVTSYIFRETALLSLMGAAAGLFFGVFLHQFVVQTAEVDAVMFGRTIASASYFYAAGMTLIFTGLVCLVMQRKLRRIDMVESLKAPE